MDYEKLDKKIIKSWRIARFLRLAGVIGVLMIPRVILSFVDFFDSIRLYTDIFIGAVFLYMFLTFIFYPIIEYRQWAYIITHDRVEIQHGIFFHNTTIVPIIRIQHVTITQGPINRRLGLSSVNIHTASGVFGIEGLSDDTARTLTENLKSRLYVRTAENDRIGGSKIE